MRKVFILIMVCILLLSFTACSFEGIGQSCMNILGGIILLPFNIVDRLDSITKTLDSLEAETLTPPYVSYEDNLYFEGNRYDLDTMFRNNPEFSSKMGYMREVLLIWEDRLWMLCVKHEEKGEKWCIVSTTLDGQDSILHYEDVFFDVYNEEISEIAYTQRVKYCEQDIFRELNAYFYDDKIVLSDYTKVIEYSIFTDEVKEHRYDSYDFPEPPIHILNDPTEEDWNELRWEFNGQEYNLSIEETEKSSKAFGQILTFKDTFIFLREIGKGNSFEKPFKQVRFEGNEPYIYCSVYNRIGNRNIVVFKLDPETKAVEYVLNEDSSFDTDLYIVPHIAF